MCVLGKGVSGGEGRGGRGFVMCAMDKILYLSIEIDSLQPSKRYSPRKRSFLNDIYPEIKDLPNDFEKSQYRHLL